MKKTYNSPSIITVNLSVRRQFMLPGSLSETSSTFFQEDATDVAMTKGVINNRNIWEEEW